MNSRDVYILGIESSCDETSVAVSRNGITLSNIISGQEVHARYGGVVPELASRAHQQHIVPVTDLALKEAKVSKRQLNAVAFTRGPGLIGSLLVGTSFAKGMALALGLPLIEVNHMQAHVAAVFATEPGQQRARPSFPFICLTVSGGHTQIVLVHSFMKMEIIGQTLDDAAGEAFDKVAKMLGLPYPGGPLIDRYAEDGDPAYWTFPHPHIQGFDFSFSGFKTAVLYTLQAEKRRNDTFPEGRLADFCASVQQSIVNILLEKLSKAMNHYGIKEVALAGGVAANRGLRKGLTELCKLNGWEAFIPPFIYCTDNAGMIALYGYYKYLDAQFAPMDTAPLARFPF
jgi:N6-L-threonylcarbamoyladenine synthase